MSHQRIIEALEAQFASQHLLFWDDPDGEFSAWVDGLSLEGVQAENTVGNRTILEILDAEQELLDARNARLEAEAQRYVAVYQVLATMGLLTVEHLQLGIPTYDPEAYYGAVEKAPSHSAQGKKLDRILEKIGN